MQRGIIHINIVCSRVKDSSLYGRGDIPLSCGSAPPLPLLSSGQSFSDSPYQIYPGYQFPSTSDDFKILWGGGGGGWSGPCDVISNDEENEPNHVSIVAISNRY